MMDITADFWFCEKDSSSCCRAPSTINTYLSKPHYRTSREAITTSTVIILMYSNILFCICHFISTTLRSRRKFITFLFTALALYTSLNPTCAAACPEVMNITSCPYFQMTDFFANYIITLLGILLVYRLAFGLPCSVIGICSSRILQGIL